MQKNINFSLPKYSKTEINLAKKILKSGKVNYWTNNSNLRFEENLKKYFDRKFAITVSSGTNALYLAFLSLKLNETDEVIVPTKTYVSSVTTILMAGIKIRFVDINIKSQNIDTNQIEKNINKNTKCILAVHLNGMSCDMKELIKIKNKYNLFLVEDCSQSHGGTFNNRKLGNFGDISVFSFCQDKIISTAGEGGCILTNNRKFHNFMWTYSDIGRNAKYKKNIYQKIHKENNNLNYKYIYNSVGLNCRMTSLQAEIGNYQLKKLDKNIRERNRLSKILNKNLSNVNYLILPETSKDSLNAFYRYCLIFKENKIKIRDMIKKINYFFPNIASYGPCPDLRGEKVIKNYLKANRIKKDNLIVTKYLEKRVLAINISNLNKINVTRLSNIILRQLKI